MNIIDLIKYLILGIVQGLTEALPISSSGHLLIFKTLMDVNIDFDTLAIITNFGSLIAIIILFRDDLKKLIISFFKYLSTKNDKYKNDYKYCWLIVIGCIPAGLMGVVVKKLGILDTIEDNVKVVGLSLLLTALLLFIIRNFKGKKKESNMNYKDALKVGSFQIIGLAPGISRSGSTIVGGILSGLERDTAFKYSFLLYIPMSIAATALEVSELLNTTISGNLILYYSIATIAAGIMTFLFTKWFRKIVNEGKLIYFVYYCLIVGGLVIIFL